MSKYIGYLLILPLVGCVTVEPIRGPSGNMGYSITCKRGIENCYREAARKCPRGYSVVGNTESTKSYVPLNGQLHAISSNNFFVECK